MDLVLWKDLSRLLYEQFQMDQMLCELEVLHGQFGNFCSICNLFTMNRKILWFNGIRAHNLRVSCPLIKRAIEQIEAISE